jgi:hypothetical protein
VRNAAIKPFSFLASNERRSAIFRKSFDFFVASRSIRRLRSLADHKQARRGGEGRRFLSRWIMNRWVMGAIVGVGAAAGAKSNAADRYVGAVEGFPGAVRIAVVVDGERWLAYVCGDSDRVNESASRWWKGSATSGAFVSDEEGASLTAKSDGKKITGVLQTKEGTSHSFVASKVASGARAGMYRATATGKSGEHQLSWIVDADGLVVGCNKGKGKRVALKPANLAPPIPKPVAKRKPKPDADAEAEAGEPAEKSAVAKAKAPAEVEEAEEEDAEPKAAADDEDEESEKVVGKKVVSATAKPTNATATKKPPAADEAEDDEEKPAKKPAKKKPADDEDGD